MLRQTIGIVTRRLSAGKQSVFAEYPGAEVTRQAAIRAKRQAVRQLDSLIPLLRQRIEGNGGHTYLAEQAADAVSIVAQIAVDRNVRKVIKTKSMLTEELQLNEGLHRVGVAVVESDLGEYIIQLAREAPAHILAPAAHKGRSQIRALFDEAADQSDMARPDNDNAEQLTKFARNRLRREFLEADMGITGGNFLVAETGTLVLITNEGNADLVTSVPPILVSVVGIEKLVATWEDLGHLIQQPAMHGIGQRLSSYTTMLSAPCRDELGEGPQEWHVVLVDNGRSSIRGSAFEDVLSCIRCGACLNVCPVFRQVGGHAYGTVYSGPIGVVETPLLSNFQVGADLPTAACTVCHACAEACPMDIDLSHHILRLRQEKVRRRLDAPSVRLTYRIWSGMWHTSAGYQRSLRLARISQKIFVRRGVLKGGPGLLKGWFTSRDMPPIADVTFHELWRQGGSRRE
jgi:L-lactate dehydrogenase complex protein LldF